MMPQKQGDSMRSHLIQFFGLSNKLKPFRKKPCDTVSGKRFYRLLLRLIYYVFVFSGRRIVYDKSHSFGFVRYYAGRFVD
jgi:hypothetical protein